MGFVQVQHYLIFYFFSLNQTLLNALYCCRSGGLTPGRQRWLNQKVAEILGASGWEIFDSYAMTLSRPDGSNDGVHYRGGVSGAMTDVVMNMIISPKTKQDYKKLYEQAKLELNRLITKKKNVGDTGAIPR